jgi:hypothetical protein
MHKEYSFSSFASFLYEKYVIYQTSCVHTPQQNGVAERKNCHLLDVTHAHLFCMHVPQTILE